MLEGLSGIASAAHVQLSAVARERALSNALSATVRAPVPRAVPPQRFGLLLAAAAALALGVVIPQLISREPSERVVSGQVLVAGSAHSTSAGEALSSQVQLHTTEAAVVALGHARVELRADSDVSWDGRSRTLELQRGSALIDVDPAQHRSFQVVTRAFGVVVLGTRFEVTQSAVQVLTGRVSVQLTAADAAPIVLAAGSERTRFELQPAAADTDGASSALAADTDAAAGAHAAGAQRARVDLQPAAAGAQAARAQRTRLDPHPSAASAEAASGTLAAHAKRASVDEARGTAARPTQPRASQHTLDASALLERARSQLAARELSQARATLALAAPHLHDAALRAQALSLAAECELQARRFDVARDTYLQVARQFSSMPAAETALFAAARIEAEHGARAHARELLSSYIAKYPRGSFVREAERRLQLLPRMKPVEPAP
jgi:hypothetical protein